MRTLAEQCAYAMRRYPTQQSGGEKFAATLYDQGYYHELAAEYGSQAAEPFAAWLAMHGVAVETIDNAPSSTLAEPEPTLAVTTAAENPHDWKQTALSIFNWIRSVDLNKYDAKSFFAPTVIMEESTTITPVHAAKPATKTRHGANGISHGLSGISHGANGISHGLSGISHGANGISHGLSGISHGKVE